MDGGRMNIWSFNGYRWNCNITYIYICYLHLCICKYTYICLQICIHLTHQSLQLWVQHAATLGIDESNCNNHYISISSCRVPRSVVKKERGWHTKNTLTIPTSPQIPASNSSVPFSQALRTWCTLACPSVSRSKTSKSHDSMVSLAHAGEWSGDPATNACFFSRPALCLSRMGMW